MRVLAAGDHFVAPALFSDALRAELPDTPLDVAHLRAAWPVEPFGPVGDAGSQVQEASGSEDEIIDALAGARVCLTQMAPFTARVFAACPQLEMVAVCRGGPVNVDLGAAERAGVAVAQAPGRNAAAAAEFAVGMMLAALRRIPLADSELRAGRWRGDLYGYDEAGQELDGATVGLVGYGAIGRIVARVVSAFGATVLVADPFADETAAAADGVRLTTLDELLRTSSVVSLHARLTEDTRGLIGAEQLALLPRGAVLVNTARGGLLDYAALPDALRSGHLGGLALDVFDTEPPPADWPLHDAPNVVATPHLAGATRQTAHRAARIAAAEVGRFVRGEPLAHPAGAHPVTGVVVGVDVGTSMTKATAYDERGHRLAHAESPSRLDRFPDGRVEQDLDDVVASASRVVREVVATAGRPVRALGLTGQGDGLWLRDADGAAVRPPISWLDDRASDVLRGWQDDGTVQEVYRRTGTGLFPGCHGPLLSVLARDEPASLERAAVAGYCVDALVQRLTGEITVDASDASLPFLDVVARRYDDVALAACGLTAWRHLLAEPATPGAVFGLDHRGAALTGLAEGTPVTGGPFDLPACALGAGVREPGDGLLIIGTTLACEVLTDHVRPGPTEEPAGMWLCTPDPGRWLRAMPAMVGTAGLDWLLDLLGVGIDALPALLDGTRPGARGVSALPFLSLSGERAPFVDTRARGQLDGVTLATSRGDVVRAVCEGIAFTARHCFERAADGTALGSRLVACGGGARSDIWAQIFADVLERPLLVPDDPGLGTRGAAMTAGRALGVDVDTGAWPVPVRAVEPSPASRGCYDEGYARYRAHVDTARRFWGRRPTER